MVGDLQLDSAKSIPTVREAASVCPSSELRRLTSWAELERLDPSAREAGLGDLEAQSRRP